jgi:hypothetical protein
MSVLDPLGFGIPRVVKRDGADIERVIYHQPLRRVLAFLGYDINDLCNDWFVKNRVWGFYKLSRDIERSCEVSDLERQWNPTGAH